MITTERKTHIVCHDCAKCLEEEYEQLTIGLIGYRRCEICGFIGLQSSNGCGIFACWSELFERIRGERNGIRKVLKLLDEWAREEMDPRIERFSLHVRKTLLDNDNHPSEV